MTTRIPLVALALSAAIVAGLPTLAVADRGPMDGGGRAQMLFDRFDEIDADKDGKVSAAELEAHRAARFAAADANGDGALDAAELSAMQMARMQDRMADRAARMIERLDGDADGRLSAEEMAAMEAPERAFGRADADGDGALTKAEVEAALTRMAEGRGHGKGHGRGHGEGRGEGRGWWGWSD